MQVPTYREVEAQIAQHPFVVHDEADAAKVPDSDRDNRLGRLSRIRGRRIFDLALQACANCLVSRVCMNVPMPHRPAHTAAYLV